MYKIVEKAGTGDFKEVTNKIENGNEAPLHTIILVKELIVEIVDNVLDQMEYMDEKNRFNLGILRFTEKQIARNLKHTISTKSRNHSKELMVERKPKVFDLLKHSKFLGTEELLTIIDLESSDSCTRADSEDTSHEPFETFKPPTDDQLEEIDLSTANSKPELIIQSPKRKCLMDLFQSSTGTTNKPKWCFTSRIIRFFKRKDE